MKIKSVNILYSIVFLAVLINFQNFGKSAALNIITPLVLFIANLNLLKSKPNQSLTTFLKKNKLYTLLFLIFLIGLLRIGRTDVSPLYIIILFLNFSLFIAITYKVIAINQDNNVETEKIMLRLLVYPFIIFVLLNLLMFYFNIQLEKFDDVNIGSAVILSQLGIYSYRVKFPLADGINSFATIISLLFFIATSLFIYTKSKSVWLIIGIISFIIVLLYTDSRSSFFYPFIVLMIVTIIKLRNKLVNLSYLLPFIYLLSPFIMIFLVQLISELGIADDYSRSATEGQTGNGRFVIWGFSFLEFVNFKFQHLIGYGVFGHFTSGASINWSILFHTYANPDVIHPHNTMISILFDFGYLGVIVYFLFLFQIINKLVQIYKQNQTISLTLIGFVFLFVLLGLTETVFCIYYSSIMYIFIFISTLVLTLKTNLNEYSKISS